MLSNFCSIRRTTCSSTPNFVLDTKVRFTSVLLKSQDAGFKSRESESTLWEGLETSCPSRWKLLSSICNNSIRFFQCSSCFDIDTLSIFKCGYFKAHSVSSVWKSPIIILSMSVSSHCSHSNTLTSADAYVHTNTQSAHTWLISVQCHWFLNSPCPALGSATERGTWD